MSDFAYTEKKTVNVTTLKVEAGVRYWEDAKVNGVEDESGDLIPFRVGDTWQPVIDVDDGVIHDWPANTTADIHYKVCDDGAYTLLDENGYVVHRKEGYVPAIMSPGGSGYGDYIIMAVGSDGRIANWRADLSDFKDDHDD